MNKRQSIYVGKDLDDLVSDMLCQGKSQSGIINGIAARYKTVIDRNVPTLSQKDWSDLMHVLFDYNVKNIVQSVNGLPGTIADSVPGDLAEYVNKLFYEEKLAIIHVSEIYWAAGGNLTLVDCGAKIG